MAALKQQLCTRCHSSLQLISSSSTSTTSDIDVEQQNEEEPPCLKQPKLSPCQYCLDLLDHTYQQLIVEETVQQLAQENYIGLNTFQLCISIPPALLLHQGITELCNRYTSETVMDEGDSITLDKGDSATTFSFGFVKENLKYDLTRALVSKLGLELDKESPFKLSLCFSHKEADQKYQSFACKGMVKKPRRGRDRSCQFRYTHEIVHRTLESATLQVMKEEELFPTVPSLETRCAVNINCFHESLFLAGRYNKYSRTLSQSPWIIDGVRKADTSVEEIMSVETEKVFRPDVITFSSSGREDVDVRMLGSGRPFMLEIGNPRLLTFDKCQQLEDDINKSTTEVAVHKLKMVDRKTGLILKSGEEEKKKLYSALIWSSKSLNAESIEFLNKISNVKIYQKTPIRVLHRRSLATRERLIHTAQVRLIDPHHFQLDLSTQAGTYIKEFVHGDFGRTTPNLCQLIGHLVDIVALDVTEIKLEWPP